MDSIFFIIFALIITIPYYLIMKFFLGKFGIVLGILFASYIWWIVAIQVVHDVKSWFRANF